jgi:undecaprenyl-diphosphatase
MMNDQTPPTTVLHIARLWPIFSAALALALVGALGAVIFYRENNKPFGFELEWMSEIVSHRSPFLSTVALVFNALGGGLIATVILPLVIIGLFVIWRRFWAALYFAIAAILSATVVQLLKALFGRPRPTDQLVSPDFGSFPSGHSAYAALIATVLGIVIARWWVWAAGAVYTVAMMLSRTYLGAHWISDTVGGMLVGAGIAVIVWAPLAYRLYREKRATHTLIWMRKPAK